MASTFTVPPDCVLTFSDVEASSGQRDSAPLLQDVTGYVRRGGVTAVMGGGGSGKTLLLRVLCGREPLLDTSGTVRCAGKPLRLGSTDLAPLGFVGQEDTSLLGELTAREVLTFHAKLGSASAAEVESVVDGIVAGLHLQDVQHNVIGTILKRGLSGGEKRRVSVGAVLASRPLVLCLDEATSGLDAAVAYTVIGAIKALAQAHGIGVMLTIHQPSARILTLCDDLILLNHGKPFYVGPTHMAVDHFAAIGFPCPPMTTPTDHFLHVVRHGQGAPDSLVQGYQRSELKASIHSSMETANTTTTMSADRQHAPFVTQVAVLFQRNLRIAMRDVSLYYLQMVLAAGFAFMTGAVFWMLPLWIGHRMSDVSNGLVWMTFITSYLQVFKIYHLFTWKERVHDERANGLYSYHAWTATNFLTSCLLMFCVYVPTLLIAYAMMGLPNAAIGTIIAFVFLIAITSEAMVEALLQFTHHLPTAILLGQGSMVILCVYAGGAFIRWSNLGFWVWLSDLSLYTFSSRGMLIAVFKHLTYTCPSNLIDTAGTCSYTGVVYPCTSPVGADGNCAVAGLTVLQGYDQVYETAEWTQFGYLVALFVGFRLIVHLCLMFPPHEVAHRAYKAIRGKTPGVQSGGGFSPSALATSPRPLLSSPSPHTAVELSSPSRPSPTTSSSSSSSSSVVSGPRLRFRDVTLTLNSSTHKELVFGITGSAQPARVLAILGPSGAGKTTLLNAISGRAPYATIAGDVTLGTGSRLSSKDLSYVPQFDCLNLELTLQQTFDSHARLQRTDAKDGRLMVEELLDVLGLADKRDWRVERLTSGERKRAAIGLGLLAQPRVLLLDEPTTGLDSATSAILVEYVIKVTRRTGVICLMTLHQPSSALFSSLDDLLLLSKGRTAFFGPVSEVVDYFQRIDLPPPDASNPADWYLDLMNDQPEAVARHWAENGSRQPSSPSPTTPPPVSSSDDDEKFSMAATERPTELQRLWTLTRLRVVYFWQEPTLYRYRLLELVLIAIFIGTLFLRLSLSILFLNEITGAVFFKVWVILFVAISGTPILVRDRLTFENEYLNRTYTAGTFCMATFLASLPYQLVSAVVFEVIVWFLVGFNDAFEPWVFSVAQSWALLLMMEGIALIVVQVLKDAMLATTFSMVVLGMLFLFPGFFVSTSDMVQSIRWMSYVVPTHYDLFAQLYNVFHAQTYDDGVGGTIAGDDILADYLHVSHSYQKWVDWVIVMCYMALFRVMHWALLKLEYRNYGHHHHQHKNVQ